MLKISVSLMKKLSQDGLATLPADTISMSPAKNQGVKLELDAPSRQRIWGNCSYFRFEVDVVPMVRI